jgi:DNA invertase Pin-like site-specific DNA recombinase
VKVKVYLMAKKAAAKARSKSPGVVPKVYSYRRFSSKLQSKGDSERRQKKTSYDRAIEVAQERGLPFDETLFQGIEKLSAYTGAHIKKGNFGKFLAAIELGLVAPKSILVIDGIDRVTRLKLLEGLDVVLRGIIGRGIAIIAGEDEYNEKNLETTIYQLIAMIQIAHKNSKEKSNRLKSTWNGKREAVIDPKQRSFNRFTKWCPAWLGIVPLGEKKVITDRKSPEWRNALKKQFDFEFLPGAKETIELIFTMRIDDEKSPINIARVLNRTAEWRPQRHPRKSQSDTDFSEAYIRQILSNPAVYGVLQPHKRDDKGRRVPVGEPIAGYYPQAITHHRYKQAQTNRVKSQSVGGRRDKFENLFRSLLYCPYCGGAMYAQYKGVGRLRRIFCTNKRSDGECCTGTTWRYDEVESLILNECHKIRPEDVLPNPNGQSKQLAEVAKQISAIETELATIDEEENQYVARLADKKFKPLHDKIAAAAATLEVRKSKLIAERGPLEAAREALQTDAKSLKAWKADLESLKKALDIKDPDKRAEVRDAMNTHLRSFIRRIDLFSRGKYSHEADYGPRYPLPERFNAATAKSGTRRFVAANAFSGDGLVAEIVDAASRKTKSFKLTEETRKLLGVPKGPATDAKERARQKHNPASVVVDIVVDIGGFLQNVPPGKFDLYYAFLNDLGKRRLSRDARFARVWFTTGSWVDLVPSGSIASSSNMVYDCEEQRHVRDRRDPDVAGLLAEFEARPPKRVRRKKI